MDDVASCFYEWERNITIKQEIDESKEQSKNDCKQVMRDVSAGRARHSDVYIVAKKSTNAAKAARQSLPSVGCDGGIADWQDFLQLHKEEHSKMIETEASVQTKGS